ncbi:hypothetical protein [Nocardioides caldifontis]|uniref:hypothetical protein n=1 Tax=Nocardioides caldifontis TaxID=2588938 RepID=UPI0011DFED25|nr:hypothetical protein [Nocardioides caldifontis]
MSVAAGIEQAQALLAADGSRLVVLEEAADRVHFRLDLESAECADCVLPAAHLTTVVAGVMREATGNPQFAVQIDDPRTEP